MGRVEEAFLPLQERDKPATVGDGFAERYSSRSAEVRRAWRGRFEESQRG
jgi:hypothetical protein